MCLKNISESCTNYLIKKEVIDSIDKQFYVYGFQLFISTVISIFSIILLAMITNNFIEALIFLFIFLPLRMTANGYHAKTYLNCFFLTNFLFLIYLLALKLPLIMLFNPLYICAFFLSIIYIFFKAPQEHPNHKLNKIKRQSNRLYAHLILYIDLIVILFAYMLRLFQLINSICITIFIVTMMMMIKNERI